MSSSLLKIHYDFSNELSQKEFFLGNLSQQFRSYYIGKGNPTAQYYQNWYTNQDPKSMIDTLLWLTNTNEEKKNKLDEELDNYFN